MQQLKKSDLSSSVLLRLVLLNSALSSIVVAFSCIAYLRASLLSVLYSKSIRVEELNVKKKKYFFLCFTFLLPPMNGMFCILDNIII